MRQVGFGVIGTGMISDFHAKALEAIDNTRLVACVDDQVNLRLVPLSLQVHGQGMRGL